MAGKRVTCPGCGHGFTTRVRGRSTHCPKCRRGVYVRRDGTVRPPAGRS